MRLPVAAETVTRSILVHEGRNSPLHFFIGHVLFMRPNDPDMSERVDQSAVPVPIEGIVHRDKHFHVFSLWLS